VNGSLAGALGGLVGGIAFGLLLQAMMSDVITVAIPALYGVSGLVAGWVVHLFNSVVFGVVFGAAMSTSWFAGYGDSYAGAGVLGLVYGVLLWVVAAGIVMPVWLDVVGFAGAPPVPNLDPMSLVGHLVYGVLLGVGYVAFRR